MPVSEAHTYFVCMCFLCTYNFVQVLEVSPVVGFVKCTQAAIFSAFTGCHQSLWLCCLIECWWLLAFPLDNSSTTTYFKAGGAMFFYGGLKFTVDAVSSR